MVHVGIRGATQEWFFLWPSSRRPGSSTQIGEARWTHEIQSAGFFWSDSIFWLVGPERAAESWTSHSRKEPWLIFEYCGGGSIAVFPAKFCEPGEEGFWKEGVFFLEGVFCCFLVFLASVCFLASVGFWLLLAFWFLLAFWRLLALGFFFLFGFCWRFASVGFLAFGFCWLFDCWLFSISKNDKEIYRNAGFWLVKTTIAKATGGNTKKTRKTHEKPKNKTTSKKNNIAPILKSLNSYKTGTWKIRVCGLSSLVTCKSSCRIFVARGNRSEPSCKKQSTKSSCSHVVCSVDVGLLLQHFVSTSFWVFIQLVLETELLLGQWQLDIYRFMGLGPLYTFTLKLASAIGAQIYLYMLCSKWLSVAKRIDIIL